MKKIMMAVAIVCAAAAVQAATIKWTTSGNVMGIDAASVTDNGAYSLSETVNLKASGNTYAFLMTIYEAGTKNVVTTFDGDSLFSGTSKKISKTFTDDEHLAGSTTYDYEIQVSSVVKALTDRKVDGDYDYSKAQIATTLTGSLTTEPSGTTSITKDITGWTVSGVQSVPEPTSGLLLLLGMAGLALRRKQK